MKRFYEDLANDHVYMELSCDEMTDIAVSIQSKIDSLKDRRERYHYWLKFDAPADYVPDGLMWSQRDEVRLQRLENLMAELTGEKQIAACSLMDDYGACPAEDEAYSDASAPAPVSDLELEVWNHLDLLEEFGNSGAVILQKSVFDDALSLLRHFRAEKADQIEAGHMMAAFVPKQLRGQLDNQFSEAEGLLKSLDDVLPYLDGAFTVNFHPGSNTAAGKEGDS